MAQQIVLLHETSNYNFGLLRKPSWVSRQLTKLTQLIIGSIKASSSLLLLLEEYQRKQQHINTTQQGGQEATQWRAVT